jgi:DNA-binding transcriptional ArsR family regulator
MSRALTPELLVLIAERFKALSEPVRLRLLNAMRARERTVSELVAETDVGQANVSKHLHVLYAAGLVRRRRDGPFVHYAIADGRIFALCDLMCDQLQANADAHHAQFATVASPRVDRLPPF